MFSNPDADAFMRKYLTCPTDVTARLVFADWLEETGIPHNAAWAYYVRLKAEAERYHIDSRERHQLDSQAEDYAPKIRANLTIPAKLFVDYPKSLLQLLPAPNITVKLGEFEVPTLLYELVPESVARENIVIPLDMQERTLLAATVDPHNYSHNCETAQKLEFILNRHIFLVAADAESILDAINRHYGQNPTETVIGCILYTFPEEHPSYSPDSDAPIVRLIELLFQEAINLRADRILMTPEIDSISVRFRINDEWINRDHPPRRLLHRITRRLAIMALIPVEYALPNPPLWGPMTGVFPLMRSGRQFRVRVTIQPSPDGPTTQIDLIRDS